MQHSKTHNRISPNIKKTFNICSILRWFIFCFEDFCNRKKKKEKKNKQKMLKDNVAGEIWPCNGGGWWGQEQMDFKTFFFFFFVLCTAQHRVDNYRKHHIIQTMITLNEKGQKKIHNYYCFDPNKKNKNKKKFKSRSFMDEIKNFSLQVSIFHYRVRFSPLFSSFGLSV